MGGGVLALMGLIGGVVAILLTHHPTSVEGPNCVFLIGNYNLTIAI